MLPRLDRIHIETTVQGLGQRKQLGVSQPWRSMCRPQRLDVQCIDLDAVAGPGFLNGTLVFFGDGAVLRDVDGVPVDVDHGDDLALFLQ